MSWPPSPLPIAIGLSKFANFDAAWADGFRPGRVLYDADEDGPEIEISGLSSAKRYRLIVWNAPAGGEDDVRCSVTPSVGDSRGWLWEAGYVTVTPIGWFSPTIGTVCTMEIEPRKGNRCAWKGKNHWDGSLMWDYRTESAGVWDGDYTAITIALSPAGGHVYLVEESTPEEVAA
jgi:hypothetical protein